MTFEPSNPDHFRVHDLTPFLRVDAPPQGDRSAVIELSPEDWEQFLILLKDDSPPPQALIDMFREKP
jgi:hypothetical protein